MGAREIFIQNVNAGNWFVAAEQLNGSAMYDILPFLAALGPRTAISANNISGVLRARGWVGSAQRIEWAGEILRTRTIPNPPPGLPVNQVAEARQFLATLTAGPAPAAGAFTITMSSPFRSGWRDPMGGPNSGGHLGSNWYVRYGMDLAAATGTDVLATFTGNVSRFQPHTPSSDTSSVYGAQLFVRSENNRMGGFYTHFTGGPAFSEGQRINIGDRLGRTLRDHLHHALVEIVGGLPGGRYTGVDLYRHFLALRDTASTISVTFKQNGTPPDVT